MTMVFSEKFVKRKPKELVRECMTQDHGGPCFKVAIAHREGDVEREVCSVTGFPGNWTDEKLADHLWTRARVYAQDMPNPQIFALLGFYGEASEPNYRQVFQIASNSEANSGPFSESSDAKGAFAQDMRQRENLHQVYMRGNAHVLEVLTRTIESSFKREEKLREENLDAFELVKTMVSEKVLNQHEFRMKEAAYQRSTDERKRLIQMAPALVNTVAGREIFPQANEDTAIIEAFADNLSEDAIAKLAGSGLFPPELLGVLASRMQKHLEKKRHEKEQAHLNELPMGDPESELK